MSRFISVLPDNPPYTKVCVEYEQGDALTRIRFTYGEGLTAAHSVDTQVLDGIIKSASDGDYTRGMKGDMRSIIGGLVPVAFREAFPFPEYARLIFDQPIPPHGMKTGVPWQFYYPMSAYASSNLVLNAIAIENRRSPQDMNRMLNILKVRVRAFGNRVRLSLRRNRDLTDVPPAALLLFDARAFLESDDPNDPAILRVISDMEALFFGNGVKKITRLINDRLTRENVRREIESDIYDFVWFYGHGSGEGIKLYDALSGILEYVPLGELIAARERSRLKPCIFICACQVGIHMAIEPKRGGENNASCIATFVQDINRRAGVTLSKRFFQAIFDGMTCAEAVHYIREDSRLTDGRGIMLFSDHPDCFYAYHWLFGYASIAAVLLGTCIFVILLSLAPVRPPHLIWLSSVICALTIPIIPLNYEATKGHLRTDFGRLFMLIAWIAALALPGAVFYAEATAVQYAILAYCAAFAACGCIQGLLTFRLTRYKEE